MAAKSGIAELPPRTRRILPPKSLIICFLGTTSAHAENTCQWTERLPAAWNYLRARGEYMLIPVIAEVAQELPPRTRRIRRPVSILELTHGTTSAHAENTCFAGSPPPHTRNYLRARGEYRICRGPCARQGELPPRTRRIHRPLASPGNGHGTTSAHAENTRGR